MAIATLFAVIMSTPGWAGWLEHRMRWHFMQFMVGLYTVWTGALCKCINMQSSIIFLTSFYAASIVGSLHAGTLLLSGTLSRRE